MPTVKLDRGLEAELILRALGLAIAAEQWDLADDLLRSIETLGRTANMPGAVESAYSMLAACNR